MLDFHLLTTETQRTVQDCLVQFGLTSLASMFQDSGLSTVLTSVESKVTVFAPRDDISGSPSGGELPARVLGTHIVDDVIPAAFLYNGQRLDTISDVLFLHISEVNSKGSEVSTTFFFCLI